MEQYDIMLGESLFLKLWRFFNFVAVPPPAPHTEWEKHKAYITHDSLERQLTKYWGHECLFLTS